MTQTQLTITMDLDNEALTPGPYNGGYGCVEEVKRVIDAAIDRIDAQAYADGHGASIPLRDYNGNRVGTLVLTDRE